MYNKIPQDLYQICYITFPKRNVLRTSVAYEIHLIMNSGKKQEYFYIIIMKDMGTCGMYAHFIVIITHTHYIYTHTKVSIQGCMYVCNMY